MANHSCSRCVFNSTLYRKRKLDLKEQNLQSKDIVLRGSVDTEHTPTSKEIYMLIFKKDMLKKIYFSGKARLSFDGFLKDEDYKLTSEESLKDYRHKGKIELIGEDDNNDWVYKIRGDFDENLPLLLFNEVQVRISPLESKIKTF